MKAKLHSINLLAGSPTRLKEFYEHVFGLEELTSISHPPGFYMLQAHGCQLMIQEAGAVNQQVGHEGFELGFEVEDLNQICARAIRHHGKIKSEQQTMGWGNAVTLLDPEGHSINVFQFTKRK